MFGQIFFRNMTTERRLRIQDSNERNCQSASRCKSQNRDERRVKSVSGVFQQLLDTMLDGLTGEVSCLDDNLIVVGLTLVEHCTNIKS